MELYQQFFNRCEKKYLIDETQYRELIGKIYSRLEYDNYKKYRICNIYFDTLQYDLIRASVEKPLYKEKFRLRSYGTPAVSDTVFLEIKKKYDGILKSYDGESFTVELEGGEEKKIMRKQAAHIEPIIRF